MKVGGLLGGVDFSSPSESMTATVRLEEDAALHHCIEAGANALAEQEWQAFEGEVDQLVREWLEPIYFEAIISLGKLSPKTKDAYLRAYKTFRKFCTAGEVCSLPAGPGVVARFLHEEIQCGASPEKIRRLVAGIAYAHQMTHLYNPTEDEIVKAVVHSTTMKAKQKEKTNGKAKNH